MEKQKLNKKVTIRLSEDDYMKYLSMFEKTKTKDNYSQSQFIRDCIFNNVPPTITKFKKVTTCDKERVRQLSGLTTNINQIARNLNILMKNHNEKKMMYYLKQLDTIADYCQSALYEEK